ncbi:MAG: hypothetical protein RIS75_663 [Actinomycetota bacterium]
MSDLQFVAISDDGKMIILQTADGQWIEVPFDAQLVGSEAPRAEVIALSVQTDEIVSMSPREIQGRIRAGSSVEEVAALSGSSIERIMSYAPPILLERSHVASKAAKTIVRRASGAGPLADVIHARLAPLGVATEDIEWDAFRREDGRWSVVVRYPSKDGVRSAIWLFDVRNSALVPGDDEARWLIGEAASKVAAVSPADPNTTPTVTHLMAVPSLKEPAHEQPTDPLLNLKLSPAQETQEAPEDFDQSLDVAEEDLNQDFEAEQDVSVEAEETETEAKESAFDRLTAPDTSDVKRPRVPSWDEILFGAPPSDDD